MAAERIAPCRSTTASYFAARSSRRNALISAAVVAVSGRRFHARVEAKCSRSTTGIALPRTALSLFLVPCSLLLFPDPCPLFPAFSSACQRGSTTQPICHVG